MIDWMNPSDDILEAKRIGYDEAVAKCEDAIKAMQEGIGHRVTELEITTLAQAVRIHELNKNEKLVDKMREFIRYWSHCTRVGMNRDCPELNPRWTEEMQELCPGGLVEHAVNDLVDMIQNT